MLGDRRVEEIAPDGVERRQGALLVDPHQARIADDIGTHDDREPMFYPGIAHLAAVSLRQIVRSAILTASRGVVL
jgi:hypothetical protein